MAESEAPSDSPQALRGDHRLSKAPSLNLAHDPSFVLTATERRELQQAIDAAISADAALLRAAPGPGVVKAEQRVSALCLEAAQLLLFTGSHKRDERLSSAYVCRPAALCLPL